MKFLGVIFICLTMIILVACSKMEPVHKNSVSNPEVQIGCVAGIVTVTVKGLEHALLDKNGNNLKCGGMST